MLRAPAVCLLTLTGVSGSAPAQNDAAVRPPSIAEVRSLMAQGKMDDALQALEVLAVQRPEPSGVERLRGIVQYENNRVVDAEASFARALAQDPDDQEAMQLRGVALYRMGRPAEAIPLLEKARGAEPIANADPSYVLGLCYIDTQRYDDARRAFAQQYGFGPDSAAAWLVTARLLFRHEQTAPAQSFARQAVKLDSRIPQAHRLLGELALARGDLQAAIAEFEQERTVDPLDGETYDRLGDAYLRSGQAARAQQALDRAVLLEPNATGPYILLGQALLEQKDPLTAAMYLERAVKMDPSNSLALMLLGRSFAAVGRKADAQREFDALEKLQEAKRAGSSAQ
jgi:tetratricopeptide (TPR) repeat protein